MDFQQQNPIKLDIDLCRKCITELERQQEEKTTALLAVMPKVPVKTKKNRPKITHKKDGTLSSHGERWFQFLREQKLPMTTTEPVEYISGYDEPNPGSTQQVKDWLYSLGWEPCTFKFVKDDNGERSIPQIRNEGELTPSVERLVEEHPELEALAGLTVIQHRLSVFQGFIDSAVELNGEYFLRAEIGGLTNTLRFKHRKPLVNLPGVAKFYGKEIRGCLIAPDGYEIVGADMVSLEDTTKRHYMQPLDPSYVEEMSVDGYDPHMKLLVISGTITEDDYEFYVKYKKENGL